jgi:hypothetical protein
MIILKQELNGLVYALLAEARHQEIPDFVFAVKEGQKG